MTDGGSPVYRAIFGDVVGAHNLLAASPGLPKSLLDDLAAHYTDRMLSTEHGWTTYRCGFPVRGYYTLTQTFPVKASRGGMVQTHAVIVPLDRIGKLDELACLANLLPTRALPADSTAAAAAPTLLATVSSQPAQSSPPGYLPVIRMLLHDRVPVWVGQDGFWDVVEHLWRNLWPAARERLYFRVAAEPNDVDQSASLVCTLKETRTNWDIRSFVDQSAPMADVVTRAEAYLAGAPERVEVAQAAVRLGFSQPKISDIKRLADYVDRLNEGSVDAVRYAARLLAQLAPDASQITEEKATVLGSLAELTARGSEADVLGLRNLNVSAFAGAGEALKYAIRTWISDRIRLGSGGQIVAKEVFLNQRDWDFFARPAVIDAFSPWLASHTVILWNWWLADPRLIEKTALVLPALPYDIERDAISTMPSSLPDAAQDNLLGLAQDRRWYQFHAAVLSKYSLQPALERFRRHIAFDTNLNYLEGMQCLAQAVEPPQLLQAAVELGDPRLLRLASEAVRRDPPLLQAIDATNANWREIWAQAVAQGLNLYEGIGDKQESGHAVLSAAVDGADCPASLLDPVATDARTNLRGYSRRAQVWPLITTYPARQTALRLVAREWLDAYLSGEPFGTTETEHDLETAVLHEWRETCHQHPAAHLLRMHERFGTLTEDDVLNWLNRAPFAQSKIDASALGKLIQQNYWRRSADRLAGLVLDRRGNLDASIHVCIGLLGRIQKMKIWLLAPEVNISEDEWWDELAEQASRLFSYGIEDTNIWSDSGGDTSLISRIASGREQWTSALNLLRKGGGGEFITVEGLLHQMRNRFVHNVELETLERTYHRGLR